MSDLGAGIGLTDDWDFSVDGTGDLTPASGIAELEKDIAFNVARNLETETGRPVTPNTRKRIQVKVRNVLVNESRIGAVNNVSVRELQRGNSYEVVADVDTGDGPFELVFEVDL